MADRRVLKTVVQAASWLTPEMRRVVVGGPDLESFSVGEFTDHYVKLRLDKVRTYTVRDFTGGRLTIDFVVHGDRGVAGPWAAAAEPGDELELMGPGGGYAPDPGADWHLLVGDEAVIPAIAVSLARIGADVPALTLIEVGSEADHQPLPREATWLHRTGEAGADPEPLLAAVAALDLPAGRGQAFVHGEATMVRLVRRHLLLERGMDAADVHASGYWKLRRTDEQWRAEKADWKAQAAADVA